MDRLACVDLPAFPLQLLCRHHPEWRERPVVVVEQDRPQGTILWVNEQARGRCILPGQRHAHALSLAPGLRAGVVSGETIEAEVARVTELLRRFSPGVAPDRGEPGVFWLDASGLERLHPSLYRWARAMVRALRGSGLSATAAVGFTRFGSYAVARHRQRPVTLLRDPAAEREAARRVPLDRLGLHPELREALGRLGVVTLGGLLRLPAGGLLDRFGEQAHRLRCMAAGEGWDPLSPEPPAEPFEQQVLFDDPERDAGRLLFAIKRALDPLLAALAGSHRALRTLFVELTMDRVEPRLRLDAIRPAEPTLDARALLRLLHLRLDAAPPAGGVTELRLAAEDVLATSEQLSLFARRPRRDLRAGAEALAHLRAVLGNDAIVCAVPRDGHLPEARYAWQIVEQLQPPRPTVGAGRRRLIRRILDRPLLLPPQKHQVRDDGWLLGGLEQGAVDRIVGPFILSGGWWRAEVHREYHFAETRRGELLWLYYDRRRRRWFQQGQIR